MYKGYRVKRNEKITWRQHVSQYLIVGTKELNNVWELSRYVPDENKQITNDWKPKWIFRDYLLVITVNFTFDSRINVNTPQRSR